MSVKAQTSTYNFVRVRTPRTKIATATRLDQLTSNKDSVETVIQYVDGLGRPLQTIQMQGSPTGKDVIQSFGYDTQSRDSVKYLPYTVSAATPGMYQPNAIMGTNGLYTSSAQYAFYQQTGQGFANTPNPYSQTGFEPSALNRPVEQGAPGGPWQLSTSGVTGSGHTVKMVYTLNNNIAFTADSVNSRRVAWYKATINSDQTRTLVANGFYPENQLTVTITKDENWTGGRGGTIEEYKDKTGHVLLKRVYNYKNSALEVLSTYYVYDDVDLLAFVLPPAVGADAAGTISQPTLNNLCYQYRYDERDRANQKKIPGKGWEYTVYNYIDQVAGTQDSLQRAQHNWIITKYDGVGRVVQAAIRNSGTVNITRAALQDTLTKITTNLWESPSAAGNGYTNVAWPTNNISATLTLNYYDNYTNVPGLSSTPYAVAPTVASPQTRGLLTANKTAVLNTLANMLWSAHYYDDLGRDVKTYAQHYLGGALNNNNYDASVTTYNFSNQPTTTTRQHWNTASTSVALVTIYNWYLYDHIGRKVKTWEQINNGNTATTKVLISKTDYNEIGQLKTKHLHSTDSVNFLQNVAYTYNERGWLLTSSAPLFTLNLYYNTSSTPQYNGNIMHQFWGPGPTVTNHYNYLYDNLNRLVNGGATTGNNENNIIYDQMGNLTRLYRYQNSTIVDQLTYSYASGGYPTNQLQSVTDASSSTVGMVPNTTFYTYDGNGNMLTQTNSVNTTKNKTFTYNLLNLPQTATTLNATIAYTYDASGNKLRKVVTSGSSSIYTNYMNGIQTTGATTESIDFIQTEEGQARYNGASSYNYAYFLSDNLGNTRITFDSATGVARKLQRDDYYPFGLEIIDTIPSPKNEYLYNKKELQEELGQYDYGARFYDPVISRWLVIDPLAEKSRRWSPYNYVENNPIKLTDPDGMATEGGPGIWDMLLTWFGIGPHREPKSDEEAQQVYTRQNELARSSRIITERTERFQRKLDWIPFVGALSHVSKGAVEHNYREAGFGLGMGLIDAVGGELIGKGGKVLVGLGKDVLEGIVGKVARQAEHLTQKDMTGAIRDIFGDPVLKNDGTPFDHLQEVTDALGGLKNQLKKLNSGINKGQFTDDILTQAEKLRSTLQKEADRLQNILIKAKNAANK